MMLPDQPVSLITFTAQPSSSGFDTFSVSVAFASDVSVLSKAVF
jgi:hypothetical protein